MSPAPDPAAQPAAAPVTRRALRTIAAFEALKGALALVASIGLLSLLHHDLRHLAEALIGHVGLDPGAHYPALLLHDVDLLRDTNMQTLMLAAAGYVGIRWAEAWGLWHERPWGEWLGALSGALYVPFELRHLVHRPTALSALVITVNVAMVAYLGWRLWRRSRPAATGRQKEGAAPS
jgi:uncharacterized membrane protein (DUF2068 family)